MPWDLQTIRDAVENTEKARAPLVSAMRRYESAWRLEFWTPDERAEAVAEGRKLYTSPIPRNTVSLANNLISGRVRIQCPAYESTAEEVKNADTRARFLEMLITRQGKALDMGLVDSLGWFALVRGRMALQVAWIYDLLSPSQRLFQPPILYRPLDPIGVGIERDHMGTRWAFHKYKEEVAVTRSRYPEIFKQGGLLESAPDADKEITITDFWYQEKGVVYNAVLVDEEFVRKPKKTQYPQVPIFERNNDPTPAMGERWRSGSILEGVLDTWGELNYMHSMLLTAVGRYFWPATYYTNVNGERMEPPDTGMGAVNWVEPGTQFLAPPMDKPDVALASDPIQMLSKYEQETTFPDVMYGDVGQMRAAYGMNLLASTAVRRIRSTKEQMQLLLEGANELALWCVQKYAPSGVSLYGYDKRSGETSSVELTSEMISTRYDNTVSIEASVPGAQLQELMAAMQLADRKILSKNTIRRGGWIPSDKDIPEDEEMRILMERIEEDPDLLRERIRLAYRDYYGRELPPNEPDFKPGTNVPPPQQQMPRPMPPQGPVPMTGQAPQAPMPVPTQMPYPMPNQEMGGPEFQGGVSPDMLGAPQGDPETQMLMEMIRNGMIPGPQDTNLMLQDRFRRR